MYRERQIQHIEATQPIPDPARVKSGKTVVMTKLSQVLKLLRNKWEGAVCSRGKVRDVKKKCMSLKVMLDAIMCKPHVPVKVKVCFHLNGIFLTGIYFSFNK